MRSVPAAHECLRLRHRPRPQPAILLSYRRMPHLNRSLSVLLPVHNLQSSLSAVVHEILDVLAELPGRFELLILDDGSTDATWDVARELAQSYPQVRLMREPIRRGTSQVIRRGLREARGDAVIGHDGHAGIDAREIVRIWRSLVGRGHATETFPSSAGFGLLRQERMDAAQPRSQPASTIDRPETAMRRPNYLSRVASRVREFTRGE
jgi:glycosyltransferase involved in cell wall biosynthesis